MVTLRAKKEAIGASKAKQNDIWNDARHRKNAACDQMYEVLGCFFLVPLRCLNAKESRLSFAFKLIYYYRSFHRIKIVVTETHQHTAKNRLVLRLLLLFNILRSHDAR